MSALDGVCLVAVRGELVSATVPVVRGVFAGAWSGRRPILVDLTETSFMDARGLRLLFELSQRIGGPRRVCVISPGGVVRRLLTLTDMELYVTLRATRAQGSAALAERANGGARAPRTGRVPAWLSTAGG
jgi:anti-anti-sigma factor